MQTENNQKFGWRDVADGAILFAFVQFGTISGALLAGKKQPLYSLTEFVAGAVVTASLYVVMRLRKRGRFFLR